MSMFAKLGQIFNRNRPPVRRTYPTRLTRPVFGPPVPNPWRSWIETQRDERVGHVEGYGEALHKFIATAQEIMLADLDDAVEMGSSAVETVEHIGDKVIWDGLRVAAVLRATIAGRYDVTRFDLGRHRIEKRTNRWASELVDHPSPLIVEVRTYLPGQCEAGENDGWDVVDHGAFMVAVRIGGGE